MTTKTGGALLVTSAIMLLIGPAGPLPADAQQAGNSASSATTSSTATPRRDRNAGPVELKPAKPAPAKRPVAPKPANNNDAAADRWTIEQALPSQAATARSRKSDVTFSSTPSLGRVPLDTGSFGIETDTKLKAYEFSDGRRTPGLEYETRQPPSYFGLGISVPTNDKSILPRPPMLPLLPRPE